MAKAQVQYLPGSVPSNGHDSPGNDSFFDEAEEETLPDHIIDEVKLALYERNKYEFIETNTRNVLLCGRSRSGKTTAVGVLKDTCYCPGKNSIFADTANARFQTFSINNKADKSVQKYTVNIIDTPGLFEVTSKDKAARTDEVLLDTIAKCLEHEITYMNVIIMFATFEAGIHPHDIEAMKKFLAMFGQSGVRIALCITHADIHPKSWREELKAQLMEHKELSQLITEDNMEILFMGCTNAKSPQFDTAKKLQASYVNTYNMREAMLHFIFGADKRAPLKQMPVATVKIVQIKEMIGTAIQNMNFFLTVRDFAVQQVQEALIGHKEVMRYVSDDQNRAYINVADLSTMLSDLTTVARQIKASTVIPQDIKTQILWPLEF